MGCKQSPFLKCLTIIALLLALGCASPVKENIRIQPPPANNIELPEGGKKIGTLTGTTDIKGITYPYNDT